ncbi:MAG: hypothetical protein U9R19_14185 [Bacteroidota bacterium]|nr:hypothetical protein [Bacteroidota bacterium]
MRHFIIFIILISLSVLSFSQQQEVPFTLADRDRLIQLEANLSALNNKVEKLDQNINKRIDNVERNFNDRIDNVERNMTNRIDRLENKFDTYFTWGFGLVLGAIFALFGFIIYDRRTTLAPVSNKQEKILNVLKELGEEDSKMRKALSNAALF